MFLCIETGENKNGKGRFQSWRIINIGKISYWTNLENNSMINGNFNMTIIRRAIGNSGIKTVKFNNFFLGNQDSRWYIAA